MMTDLTKREAFYFIVSSLACLSVLITILAFWAKEQPKCWEKYTTEEQAIAMCER